MTMNFSGEYPEDWPQIAERVKEEAGWRCVRCGHPHERPGRRLLCDDQCDRRRHHGGRCNDGKQRMLTIHHLTGDKSDNRWWNLLPLCQVCHLVIQAKVDPFRPWAMLEHSEWFKPYVAGFYAWRYLGEELTREQVMDRLDELASMEMIRA